MAVSIQDVADRAKVSISTVSRVLNRRNIVNAKTRQRVESAIVELGYSPNVFARGLMLRRTHIMGLVLPNLHGDFYSELIRGANTRACELGYKLMISSVGGDGDSEDYLSAVSDHGMVDGLAVMIVDVNARARASLERVHTPLVLLGSEVSGAAFDSVTIDQRGGAVAMMQHLVGKCGARTVVFVGGPEANIDSIDRLDAYRSVMREHGCEVGPDDVFNLDFEYPRAHAFALTKVKEWARRGATIFAANDEMAAGVINAALELGLTIPGDLPVAGFDDTRIAAMTSPKLTTVHVPIGAMGASAVELLSQRLENPKRPLGRLTLQPQLVVRDSCGARGRNGAPTTISMRRTSPAAG